MNQKQPAHSPEPLENLHLEGLVPLISPRELKAKLPATEAAARTVRSARRALRDAIHGRDARRLVVIVGPCSIHDPDAALEYARRLAKTAEALREDLLVVMRTFFEKPRTTIGWKGLINDPHLDGSCDVGTGLELARSLLLELGELGIACASEILDPFTPQFVADLLSWGGIGARTAESQTHRQLASGLSMPVGFKNGTDGSLPAAQNAMIAASHSHSFLGITPEGRSAVVTTTGNPDRHLVLRGGGGRTNFAREDIAQAAALVAEQGIARGVMVDCSHDNSGKDPARQGAVCRAVLSQLGGGRPQPLLGLQIESFLEPGRQTWRRGEPLARGVSITDGCIGWTETEALLGEIAQAVRASD
ncbi:MAG TPA: 3-deoxy-7-phosphoheptulonate synthase [Myxococcota bacterium]|jgi:3-deoxy-7-phosphoheptulonate synthase